MFVQPQHQDNSRALARESADSRPSSAPVYHLGRPASLWLSVTSPAGAHDEPGHLADAVTGSRETHTIVTGSFRAALCLDGWERRSIWCRDVVTAKLVRLPLARRR